jgi:hypothetical protein
MAFCKQVCPWAVKQAKQASTWRGLAIGIGGLITLINPAAGVAVAKAVAVAVGVVDVVKNDGKRASDNNTQ